MEHRRTRAAARMHAAPSPVDARALLLDNDVRRREEDRHRGNNREQREYDQTKAVHHHRRKLPITDEVGPLVGLPHAARDELQLAQNELQLALRRRA